MYDNSDFLSGYEPPIRMIQKAIETKMENDCVRAVQEYGFIVDKEELKKALEYDRGQYEDGYEDGYRQGVINGRPKGEWTVSGYIDTCRGYVAKCPFCKEDTVGGGNFCPNCGADMRGGAEE